MLQCLCLCFACLCLCAEEWLEDVEGGWESDEVVEEEEGSELVRTEEVEVEDVEVVVWVEGGEVRGVEDEEDEEGWEVGVEG